MFASGRPVKVVKFALRSEQATSVGGLAEWDSVDEALQAVFLANHCTIDSPADSPYPYNVKLIFSTVPISEQRAQRVREHCAQQQPPPRGEGDSNASGNGNESKPSAAESYSSASSASAFSGPRLSRVHYRKTRIF